MSFLKDAMKKFFFLLLYWQHRNTPYDEVFEQYTLVLKAARRCAYDLAHAADMIDRRGHYAEFSEIFAKNARMWLGIFSPTGAKDYRHRLHQEANMLELRVERLRDFCQKNGLDPNTVDDQF